MSSEHIPPRDELIQWAGVLASTAAVLLFGFVIGAAWVGMQVQATGCVGEIGATGACTVLPQVETWVNRAVGAVVMLFIASFGAEWYDQQREGGDEAAEVSA